MDERPQTANDVAFAKRVLDHIDGAFDAETESVFVCQ
jgi:hypothetical protein